MGRRITCQADGSVKGDQLRSTQLCPEGSLPPPFSSLFLQREELGALGQRAGLEAEEGVELHACPAELQGSGQRRSSKKEMFCNAPSVASCVALPPHPASPSYTLTTPPTLGRSRGRHAVTARVCSSRERLATRSALQPAVVGCGGWVESGRDPCRLLHCFVGVDLRVPLINACARQQRRHHRPWRGVPQHAGQVEGGVHQEGGSRIMRNDMHEK